MMLMQRRAAPTIKQLAPSNDQSPQHAPLHWLLLVVLLGCVRVAESTCAATVARDPRPCRRVAAPDVPKLTIDGPNKGMLKLGQTLIHFADAGSFVHALEMT
jgi:hypothetical protein